MHLNQLRFTLFGVLLMLIIGGGYSFIKAPIQVLPNLKDKKVTVNILWPSQPANHVESQITSRLESRFSSLEYLKKITSYSTNGLAHIEVYFKANADLTEMSNQIDSLISSTPSLPYDIRRPSIIINQRSSSLAATFAITSNGEDLDWIREQAKWESIWLPKIRSIEGVSNVSFMSQFKPQIKIELKKESLSQLKINPSEVLNLLEAKFTPLPSTTYDTGKREFSVIVDTVLSISELENLLIQENINGSILLKDISTVSFEYDSRASLTFIDGKPGIAVNIKSSFEADLPMLMNKVLAINNEYNKESNNTYSHVFYDNSEQLVDVNKKLWLSLLVSCLLSFLSIYFLMGKNTNVSILVFLAIPFSFLCTNLFLFFLGHNHNMLVLVGLAFASGVVVDNAIVVAESIQKKLREGTKVRKAALLGLKSTALPIGAGTATTVIVLLPIMFITDGAGVLLRDMTIPMLLSISFSFVYAIFVIPLYIRGESDNKSNLYHNKETKALPVIRSGFISQAILLSSVLLSIYIVLKLIPTPGFLPDSKTNIILGNLFPDPSLNTTKIQSLRKPLEKMLTPLLTKTDDSPSLIYLSSSNTPPSYKIKTTDELKGSEVVKKLKHFTSAIPDAFMASYQKTLLPSEKTSNITLHIVGDDIKESSKLALLIWQKIPSIILGSSTSYPWVGVNSLQKKFFLDQKKLKRLEFTPIEVSRNIAIFSDELLAFEGVIGTKNYDVMLAVEKSSEQEDVDDFAIYSSDRSLFKLWQLGKREDNYFAGFIPHINGKRTISLTINLPQNITIGEAKENISLHLLNKINIPTNVRISLDENIGEFENFKEQTIESFILALTFIYIILAIFFRNFKTPILLIFSTLFAIAGGIFGLQLAKLIWEIKFNLVTATGFIILVGIVINNSILIVKEVIQIGNKNTLSDITLIITEAVNCRKRPILITSITTIIGFIPLLFHIGSGSEFYVGISLVLILGLITSLFSSFYLLPLIIILFPRLIFSKNHLPQKQCYEKS